MSIHAFQALAPAPTAFELRKKIVDPVAAKEIFNRGFAMAAFNAGAPGRKVRATRLR
jgi:hypothetical protein